MTCRATQLGNPVSEGDVGSAPGHIGRYGDLLPFPGGGNNFSLFLSCRAFSTW